MYNRHILAFMKAEISNTKALLVTLNNIVIDYEGSLQKMEKSFYEYQQGLADQERKK